MINHLCILTILLLSLSSVFEANSKNESAQDGKAYIPKQNLTFENNETVEEYLGIPFAKPPIGDLRFMPPQKYENKSTNSSPFNASTPAATCPQYVLNTSVYAIDVWNPPGNNISEDCLQLNMWVPKNNDTNKPVLVNLCGSAYYRLSASNDIFNGSVLAAYSRAIVVNLNFRLGALGFARHNESGIKGNMGLLDQQMGLQWIQENIQQFGGDPSKVTLLGDQAGASSAQAHLYAKNSTGLFKRIALTSGVLENPWASRSNRFGEKTTERLASLLNCTNKNETDKEEVKKDTDSQESKNVNLTCLQEKNYTEILNATFKIKNETGLTFGFPFSLIFKDGEFFNQNITKQKPNISNIDIMIGNTKNEGSFFLWFYFNKTANCNLNMTAQPMTGNCNVTENAFNTIVQNISDIFGKDEEWQKKVKSHYNGSETNRTEVTQKLLTDLLFDCGLKQFADNITENNSGKSYVYDFRHRSNEINATWPYSFGTVHAALAEFLFGRPFRYPNHYKDNTTLKEEKEMSRKIMELYGNFAKNGSPASDWEPYKKDDKKILILNNNFNSTIKSYSYNQTEYGGNCDWLINRFEQEVIAKKNTKKSNNKKS